MSETIHLLPSDELPPRQMTYPFCYEPHPLCRQAARLVQAYVADCDVLRQDADRGKMFGVLVVALPGDGPLAFLAAYSGLLAGRNDWAWFVPPIFDAQQPDGHFKQEEARITALNREISRREASDERRHLARQAEKARQQAAQAVQAGRQKLQQAKWLRDVRRLHHNLSAEEHAELVRESQFLKAEQHRLKKKWQADVDATQAALDAFDRHTHSLKDERHRRSDQLQRWLFSQYILRNARDETRPLLQVFADQATSPDALPPAGSGDCCAPKLLQQAYRLGLRPLCMAEFWWGASPQGQLRQHLAFYPACRGKCLPILPWMMQGLDVEPNPMDMPPKHLSAEDQSLAVVYEDDWLAVVVKPAGLLSVPGKIRRTSVEELLRRRWHDDVTPLIVHRLDMETSGLMVVARTRWAHAELQRQFSDRRVEKEYVAVLDGAWPDGRPLKGTVSLPLRPDLLDRPRQMADPEGGREALTSYEVTETDGCRTRVRLHPHTGRTHQLRVHCAHADGLGLPIVGDELYGRRGRRLLLHAARLAFHHPKTGEQLSFASEPPF